VRLHRRLRACLGGRGKAETFRDLRLLDLIEVPAVVLVPVTVVGVGRLVDQIAAGGQPGNGFDVGCRRSDVAVQVIWGDILEPGQDLAEDLRLAYTPLPAASSSAPRAGQLNMESVSTAE
jgi:hypothetical protein